MANANPPFRKARTYRAVMFQNGTTSSAVVDLEALNVRQKRDRDEEDAKWVVPFGKNKRLNVEVGEPLFQAKREDDMEYHSNTTYAEVFSSFNSIAVGSLHHDNFRKFIQDNFDFVGISIGRVTFDQENIRQDSGQRKPLGYCKTGTFTFMPIENPVDAGTPLMWDVPTKDQLDNDTAYAGYDGKQTGVFRPYTSKPFDEHMENVLDSVGTVADPETTVMADIDYEDVFEKTMVFLHEVMRAAALPDFAMFDKDVWKMRGAVPTVSPATDTLVGTMRDVRVRAAFMGVSKSIHDSVITETRTIVAVTLTPAGMEETGTAMLKPGV